jgi:hypothetical protein
MTNAATDRSEVSFPFIGHEPPSARCVPFAQVSCAGPPPDLLGPGRGGAARKAHAGVRKRQRSTADGNGVGGRPVRKQDGYRSRHAAHPVKRECFVAENGDIPATETEHIDVECWHVRGFVSGWDLDHS